MTPIGESVRIEPEVAGAGALVLDVDLKLALPARKPTAVLSLAMALALADDVAVFVGDGEIEVARAVAAQRRLGEFLAVEFQPVSYFPFRRHRVAHEFCGTAFAFDGHDFGLID